MVDSSGIIIASARGFRECVVCIVYKLEFSGSFWSFWRVDWYAIGVGFQGCSRRYTLGCSCKIGGKAYRLYASRICCWVAEEAIPRTTSARQS